MVSTGLPSNREQHLVDLWEKTKAQIVVGYTYKIAVYMAPTTTVIMVASYNITTRRFLSGCTDLLTRVYALMGGGGGGDADWDLEGGESNYEFPKSIFGKPKKQNFSDTLEKECTMHSTHKSAVVEPPPPISA